MKLNETSKGMSTVISAYVAGQFITSSLVVVFTFSVLTLLHVPAALVLALIAGVFDILPVIGFFVSIIPAAAMALTVSPKTALILLGSYLIYHQVENYWIGPKIYGNKMRLSTLTVLVSLLAGTLLGGILGAIAILPLIASYPVIERIWLKRVLGSDVIIKHQGTTSEEASS